MAASDPVVGTDRSVVDTVIEMVSRRAYRQARLQLAAHERRLGLAGVADIVGRITSPPADVDPRTEALARHNVPERLPEWLSGPTVDEVVRICARQSMHDQKVDTLIARLLAASIVDESVPGAEPHDLAHRALDDWDARPMPAGTVLDLSADQARVEQPPTHTPDRSLTDWLARRG